MNYQLVSDTKSKDVDYLPHGAAMDFIYSHEREVIIAGPAETGKTLAACWKAHILASKYPGCQGAIVRKTYKSMTGSVLQTFERVIKGAPVEIYGGERPEKYIYSNGSMIWLGGMDNPDKVLSSERDFFYVNQAEEFELNDWETMTTRATGRSAVIPFPQVFGDCNPSGSQHWILQRSKAGKMKLLTSVHADNPMLVDGEGNVTTQGKRTFETLDALTGVRYKRLRLGLWATAEGAVYDSFDNAVHVKERELSEFIYFALAIDEGYTNPAVILMVGVDSDKRWHIFKEFYQRGVLQERVCNQASEWKSKYNCQLVAVDASAAGLIADLKNYGIPAKAAKGRVLDGIQAIQNKLKIQNDGKPRLTVDPACVNAINEFESYVWKPEKDEPVKENDHAMDALRYLDFIDNPPTHLSESYQVALPSKWQSEAEPTTGRWRK
jgi:PBSX family phage terminase large subunit